MDSVEICAGGGGQALGLELAGFDHLVLVDNDECACRTLRCNRPQWNVLHEDVKTFLKKQADAYIGKVDLLAGGVPCPPFSVAGKQLGHNDDRDLFPTAMALVRKLMPRAVMLENVKGLLQPRFDDYRKNLDKQFRRMGFRSTWKLLQASDFGVPQLRPRVVCVALRADLFPQFVWENVQRLPHLEGAATVGTALAPLMRANGWPGVDEWAALANRIAPTLVGGSKKHGGPDLGPTRAKRAWAEMGVDALGLADVAPSHHHVGAPKLTVPMAAVLQGFPPDWRFVGGKTAAYRQVGNAFPPPVAAAVATVIRQILEHDDD